jgi:NAD(P)-dependent dehydrogenase (short-subunit alcohol dehydrogenase family)
MTAGRAEAHADIETVDLTGTTALVTGATSGIGKETALALGRLGARVLVHGRDRAKGEAVVDQLRESGADGAELYLASFEEMDTVAGLADAVAADCDHLDVLVNNAGGYFGDSALTPDGIERTFAVNHLAPFVLTTTLLPELRAGSGRVVTVSSEAHRGGDVPTRQRTDESGSESGLDLDLEALRSTAGYSGWDAYCRSKLANVLFTTELAERLDPATVTANCCHPGVVLGSGFTRNMALPARAMTWVLSRTPAWLPKPVVDTPAEAAATQTYLAVSHDVADVTGAYFKQCEQAEPAGKATDTELGRALWEASAELAGLGPASLPSRQ